MTTMASLNRQSAAFASGVSRTLAAAGVRPLPSGTSRSREGLRVTGHGVNSAHVVVGLDLPRHARIVTAAATEALTAAGYVVADENTDGGVPSFTVTRPTGGAR